MKKALILKFVNAVLKRNKNCILSTSSLDGKPESAAMNYCEIKNGKLYFYCYYDTRKYPNLKNNPRVSVVVYNEPDYIQMDGTIKELSEIKAKQARKKLIKKHGRVEYHSDKRCRYFLFKPNWISVRTDPTYPATYQIIEI